MSVRPPTIDRTSAIDVTTWLRTWLRTSESCRVPPLSSDRFPSLVAIRPDASASLEPTSPVW